MPAASFVLCSKQTKGLVVGGKSAISNGTAIAGAESCLKPGEWVKMGLCLSSTITVPTPGYFIR